MTPLPAADAFNLIVSITIAISRKSTLWKSFLKLTFFSFLPRQQSFCSAATRKLLRERALVARDKKRQALDKRAINAADQLTFYNLLIDNIDADSEFLGCSDFDSSELLRLERAISRAYIIRYK